MTTREQIKAAEIWRDAPDYDGYQVSNMGNIRSTKRGKVKNRKSGNSRGYLSIVLSKNGKPHSRTVHGLVAEVFIGPRPEGHHVCHNDHNRQNNKADNLHYGTPLQNVRECIVAGRRASGERHPSSKITNQDVQWVLCNWANKSLTQEQMAKKLGVCRTSIQRIIYGKIWKAVANHTYKPKIRDLPRGVYFEYGKYRARISLAGKRRDIGCFSNIEEADKALKAARLKAMVEAEHPAEKGNG
jgi:hypothetical protein